MVSHGMQRFKILRDIPINAILVKDFCHIRTGKSLEITISLHTVDQEVRFLTHRLRLLRVIIRACQKLILVHGIQGHRAVMPQLRFFIRKLLIKFGLIKSKNGFNIVHIAVLRDLLNNRRNNNRKHCTELIFIHTDSLPSKCRYCRDVSVANTSLIRAVKAEQATLPECHRPIYRVNIQRSSTGLAAVCDLLCKVHSLIPVSRGVEPETEVQITILPDKFRMIYGNIAAVILNYFKYPPVSIIPAQGSFLKYTHFI